MPLPSSLEEIMSLVELDDQPFRQTLRLIDAIEWVIKWSTALTVSDLFRTAGFSDRMRLLAAEGLRSPSLGIWVRFLRTALDELPSDSAWRRWDRVIAADQRHGLVAFRNAYAHGAVPPDDRCRADVERFRPVLDHLLASPILEPRLLAPADGRPFGDARSAVVEVPELSEPQLDLWPIALHLPVGSSGDGHSFHFFNALRDRNVETLNYELAERQRRKDLWGPFHDRLPLDRWRSEAIGMEPFRDEIRALTDQFKGRSEERGRISQFMTDGGMLFLFGPPGIGKSALVALSVLEHRTSNAERALTNAERSADGDHPSAPEQPPHVVEHLIRRRKASELPTNFLSGVIRRIDALYGFPSARPASTDDELFDLLKERVWRIRSNPELPPLVLVVDGLDEGPEIGRFLVRGDERVRVLCTGREVPTVVEMYQSWVADGARRTTLGALSATDVRAILYDVVDKYDDRLDDRFIEALTVRSGGNPLFLSLYSTDLFDHPDLLGDISSLPTGLAAIIANAVDRVTDRASNVVALDVLSCLAVCAEALDIQTLAVLLNRRRAEIRVGVDDCRELLVEATAVHGEAPRFQLFHETLREWLETNHGDDLADMERAITDVAAQPGGALEGYMGRWGLRHLAAAAAREPGRWWTPLLRELIDPDRLGARMAAGPPEMIVDDVLDGYRVASPGEQEHIARSLATVVLRDAVSNEPSFIPETIHGMFAYRTETACYDRMLVHLTDPHFATALRLDRDADLRVGLLHCAGTRARRRDGVSGDAEQLLVDAAGLARADGSGVHDSRIFYDLAYLHFLAGRVADAVEGFERSQIAAENAGEEVAAQIATCLTGLVRWHAGEVTGDQFKPVLDRALASFAVASERSANAERWVMNVRVHLFDLALERRDVDEAERLLGAVRTDSWAQRYWSDSELLKLSARLDLCHGRYQSAAGGFEAVLATVAPDGRPAGPVEQLARLYAELASSFRGLGEIERAEVAASAGHSCPSDAGNWMWQRRGRAWPP